MKYAKVRINRRTVYIEVLSESARFITGYEINKYGDPIIPNGAPGGRLRIIEKVIAKITPMKMNLHYCELEEVAK